MIVGFLFFAGSLVDGVMIVDPCAGRSGGRAVGEGIGDTTLSG